MKNVPAHARKTCDRHTIAACIALIGLFATSGVCATTVKHVERLALQFSEGSAELQPQHRRDIIQLARSIDRHCLPKPSGGVVLVIQAKQHRDHQSMVRERVSAVRSMLERLTLSGATLIDDLMTEQQWHSRATATGLTQRRASNDTVLVDLTCDPR
jgi:hypothetical protein